jgi:hypothetical protein
MLKRLAILGLLLTVMQAPAPIPGQAANNPAGGSHDVQKQDGKSQSNAKPAPSTLQESGARPAHPDTDNPATKNASDSVSIREFPTVSIGKDWADWSYWGFGGILVVVGSLQVLLLRGTLRAVEIQGRHMERQTKALEDSVAAAQKSADAALAQVEAAKSAQRAQLRIEFAEPDFVFDEGLGGYPIRYEVILDGTTRAYVPQNSILAYMGQTARTKRSVWMELHIPRNFTPEMSPYKDYTLLRENAEGFPDVDTDPGKAELVEKHNFTVFVDGHIGYRDIFGDEWRLEIDRCWVPNSRHYGEGATGGMWVPFSSGRYDTHSKVDTSRRDQYLKARKEAQKPN